MEVSNHMSVMDEEMMKKVEQFFKDVKRGATPSEQDTIKKRQNRLKQRDTQRGMKAVKEKVPVKSVPHKAVESKKAKSTRESRSTESDRQKETRPGKRQQGKKHSTGKAGGKNQQRRRGGRRQERREAPKQEPKRPDRIEVSGPLTVGEVAKRMRREAAELIRKLMANGVMATINQEIDVETIELIAAEFGVEVDVKEEVDESIFEEIEEKDAPEDLQERPPVVTIMGHVDHGKTTLLDSIRNTKVAAQEAGGITQHIGAYQVDVDGKKITFLDTPGHAAFTTMRARGAELTDITILVVAADDGVMPQTVEAINHAKAAKVPIIVAVNKMDKPEANPDRIKQQLSEHGLVPEEWGGDTVYVHISALKGEGLDELLEMVLLVAEIQELKANPNKRARGIVIDAELDKGRGVVATLLVQNGTLKVGDVLVAGNYFGKVRAMINDMGRRVKSAAPSTPVAILGLSDVPAAGEQFIVYEDEKKARAIAQRREERQRAQDWDSLHGLRWMIYTSRFKRAMLRN